VIVITPIIRSGAALPQRHVAPCSGGNLVNSFGSVVLRPNRWIAVACLSLAVALPLAGLPVLGWATPAVAAVVPQAMTATSDSAVRPDSVSAMVTARSTNHPVEDLSQRTQTSSVFANPDGTWTADTTAEPKQVQDDSGAWHDVNTDLVDTADGLTPIYAATDVVLSDGGDTTFASVTADKKTLDWNWPTSLPKPTIDGDTATYADALPNADLVVTATVTGFTHSIVLRQAPTSALNITMPITTDGARLVDDPSGGVSIESKPGMDIVAAAEPLMYDSSNDSGGEPNAVPVVTTVGQDAAGTSTLTLSPDQSFLTDPSTVYPVTVDPSFTTNTTGDVWAESADLTAGQTSSTELRAGTYDGGGHKARSWMHFDVGTFAHKHILSANLVMKNFGANSCTAGAIRVNKILGSWNANTLTWANQPTVGTTNYDDYAPAHGYSASCPSADATFDVTAMTQSWADGSANYGLRLKANDETANNTWRRYRSANYGGATQPHINVTYNSYPNQVWTPTVSPGYSGYTTSLTPTLKAEVTDPNLGMVRGKFEVWHGATLTWSGTSAYVPDHSMATIAVPAGKLMDGSVYTVKVLGNDGIDDSKTYSPSTTFTVDVTAPSVTTTANGFTDGVWTTTPPASNTFTFHGSSDTNVFMISEDGVNVGPAQHIGSTGMGTVNWLPTSGAHIVTATPVDFAGNTGTPSSFSFGVGPASFTTPSVAQQSTGLFPVNISGPPNATDATLSWRVAGTTPWNIAASITTESGAAWHGSVSAQDGGSTSGNLLWTATDETDPRTHANLAAPAVIEVRACFDYAVGAQVCTDTREIQLVPSAFGGNFPVVSLGPAQVALFTGEMSLSASDVSDSAAGFGRTFSSFDNGTVSDGVFGPGWSDSPVLTASGDASSTVIDNRTKDGSFVIVDSTGGSQAFVADGVSATTFVPLEPTGDATSLVYTSGSPDTLKLTRPLGTGSVTTSWTFEASDTGDAASSWVLDGVDAPGTALDLTVDADHQRPTWIQESDPTASATCSQTTQTAGCRALAIEYAGSGSATRVTSVSRIVGAANQTDVTTTTIASYLYDTSGKLTSVCGAVPSAGKPALCTDYSYATVDGRTVIAQVTPPGMQPWRYEYTSSGRLLTVTREKPTGGDATWSVDYGLSVGTTGLPDMSANARTAWGQSDGPTKVFAVYSPTAGAFDVTNASLYYSLDDGTMTNSAVYGPSGWLIDTQWYDAFGNVVQHLDGTGWARVQAAPTGDRPNVADAASSFTVYNTWGGDDVVGTRVVGEYGPAHAAVLKDGTPGMYRSHTAYLYDDDPNTPSALIQSRPGAVGLGLVLQTTTSASSVDRTADFDPQLTKYGYDPVTTSDGNGWIIGNPTTVSTQIDTTRWSTTAERFDSTGRVIETRQPGGSVDSTGAGSDAHATVTTYYTSDGSGDCGSKPAWAGLACKVGPASQPTGTTMPITYTSSYNAMLQPTTVQEISGGVTARTTTTTYDNLGRVESVTKQTTGPGVANETLSTTYGFDDQTGLPTTSTSNGHTITTSYDTWGRTIGYTDALGTSSSVSYDPAGQIASVNDGSGTYSYTHDTHELLTSVDAGGGVGTFAYNYTAAGLLDTVTYPNGVTAKYSYDEVGTPTGLAYYQGGTPLVAFSDTGDVGGRTVASTSTASNQSFDYDGLGRLTSVEDTRGDGCTTRTYGFDTSSNRTSFASFDPTTDTGACQTTTASMTKTNTFDSSGRLRNTGYVYDTLGRTVTSPQGDTGVGALGNLAATYHADDMVASLAQNVSDGLGGTTATTMTYGLDPDERVNTITTAKNGSETQRRRYRFSGESDGPAVIDSSADGGSTWISTRNVVVPELGVAASSTGGTVTLLIENIHGDIVATMPSGTGSTTLNTYAETDEYGNAVGDTSALLYAWLGIHQRSDDAVGGLTLMGSRLYNPTTGAFLSPDPVLGGNSTSYTYPQDPTNQEDLDGQGLCIMHLGWCSRDAIRHTGAIVHIDDGIWHKITTGKHGVPKWLAYRAIFYGHAVFGEGNSNTYSVYRFTVWDWNCNGVRCQRGGDHVQIRFVVDWVDGKIDHGFLVSMYCETARGHQCPDWVGALGPYLGPPGPQIY
jgi:RHS repeat-associated protein